MNTNTYYFSLNFEQILELVKQLPKSDRVRLSQELEKEIVSKNSSETNETATTDKPVLYYKDNVLVFEAESIESPEDMLSMIDTVREERRNQYFTNT